MPREQSWDLETCLAMFGWIRGGEKCHQHTPCNCNLVVVLQPIQSPPHRVLRVPPLPISVPPFCRSPGICCRLLDRLNRHGLKQFCNQIALDVAGPDVSVEKGGTNQRQHAATWSTETSEGRHGPKGDCSGVCRCAVKPSVLCALLECTELSSTHQIVQFQGCHAVMQKREMADVFRLTCSIQKTCHCRAIE